MGSTSRPTCSKYVQCILSFLILYHFARYRDISFLTISWYAFSRYRDIRSHGIIRRVVSHGTVSYSDKEIEDLIRPVFGASTWRWTWCQLALGRWWCCCSLLRCCSTFAGTSAERKMLKHHFGQCFENCHLQSWRAVILYFIFNKTQVVFKTK